MNEKKEKTRIAYTASRKAPAFWLSLIFGALALVGFLLRAFWFQPADTGCWTLWIRELIPCLASLYLVYQMAMNGKDRVYRLTLPYWALLLSLVYGVWGCLAWYWALLITLGCLALAYLMRRCLTGTLGHDWLPILLAGLPMVWLIRRHIETIRNSVFSWPELLSFLPELLLLLAYVALCFALKRVEDGAYHPTWGDRFDGRRVRSLSPISAVGTYIMPERNQANVFFNDKLEISALEKYIRSKRAQGFEHFGMTEALLAAYVRTVSKFPGANRFISGEKIYTRDEDMQFCMTVKKDMTKEAPDTVIKVHLKPGDSVEEVYRKFHAALDDAKKSMELDSSLDGVTALFNMVPGVLLKFVVWLLKLLDYFGLLPRFILEVSPFHGSIFFTSMGSLGIPAVYHHLYNFGNLPIFLAFGRKYRVNELADDGSVVSRKYMDYTFNVDERIVDGFYYATLIKFFHKLLLHPERLDDPEMEVNRDIP